MTLTLMQMLVVAAGFALGAGPDPKLVADELKAFQGSWSLASGIADGEPMKETDVKRYKRTFKGDRFTFTEEGRIVLEGTIVLDPTQTPRTIDLKFVDKDKKEGKLLGIYKLDGDEATHCLHGEARPATLTCEKGSGHILLVWRRDK